MSTIDVRDGAEKPTEILFANQGYSYHVADRVMQDFSGERPAGVKIVDSIDEYVTVATKDDAEGLMRALNKAVDLGWLK
jgi:hypothetical protein